MIGEPTEYEGAERPRRKRQEQELRHLLVADPEFLADRDLEENEQEEIERVEGPAEVARPDRVALRRLERFQVGDQAHTAAPPGCSQRGAGAFPAQAPDNRLSNDLPTNDKLCIVYR